MSEKQESWYEILCSVYWKIKTEFGRRKREMTNRRFMVVVREYMPVMGVTVGDVNDRARLRKTIHCGNLWEQLNNTDQHLNGTYQ